MKIFLPFVLKDSNENDAVEDMLFDLISNSSYQKRAAMYQNVLLWAAAQRKADDMAEKDYFGHTSPSGLTANELVRDMGYKLPDWYAKKGNNVESISVGGGKPENVMLGWLHSPGHRKHVFGEIDFYKNQECVGIGKSVAKDGRILTVFISCPCY